MAAPTREVITLQCGHYSNFVGTHIWNIQESSFCYEPIPGSSPSKQIDHDVLYREGLTIAGTPTYTPRLIAWDLKGSLNTLRAEGVLYNDVPVQEEDIKWEGDVTLHKGTPPHKNEFLADLDAQDELLYTQASSKEEDQSSQDTDTMETEENPADAAEKKEQKPKKMYYLDESVVVWSDYLYGHMHPKTVSVIREFSHDSDVEPFELYTQGKTLMQKPSMEDDLEDRLHFFAEECDHLQGFQVLVDFYNGFSGVGCSLLEYLEDEYSGKGILTVGVAPTTFSRETPAAESHRVINSALAFQKLSSHSSLFLPISASRTLWRKPGPPVGFPHISYNSSLNYHTSAILASSLETMMLPYRTVENPLTVNILSEALSTMGRKIGSLQSSLPFPFQLGNTLASEFNSLDGNVPWRSLTPYTHNPSAVPFAQSVVLRGIPKDKLVVPGKHPTNNLELCKTGSEMLSLYLSGQYPRSLNSALCVYQASKTVAPYPHIFNENVRHEGYLSNETRSQTLGVSSVPMMTSLQSSPTTGHLLAELVKQSQRLDIRKFHGYVEGGLEPDEFKETMDNLQAMSECYTTDMMEAE
ncbi:protein misato homolog 1-like [Amphiura filiformis]|uniref:protein misato homolog 1-like n=1 Tax=Amphiura filiformis TaxID=82378 RepID=UPI003B22285B